MKIFFSSLLSLFFLFVTVSYSIELTIQETVGEDLAAGYDVEGAFVALMDNGKIAKKLYRHTGPLMKISWSGDHRFLAFQAVLHYDKQEMEKTGGEYGIKLVVLDQQYSPVVEIPNVMKYTWKPDESVLAIIEGQATGMGAGLLPERVYTYTIDTKETVEIPVKAYNLSWAKHSDRIYLDMLEGSPRVMEFDPEKQKTTPTLYKGIYFSSDGIFYIDMPLEIGESGVYRTKDNTKINEPYPFDQQYVYYSGWVEDSHCVVVNFRTENFLVNLDNGRCVALDQKVVSRTRANLRKKDLGDPAKWKAVQ